MVNYYSIASLTEDELVINKSRFLTYLLPVDSEEDIEDALSQIRKAHPKATHHCYAYILSEDGIIQKSNDDGEPSGTAGIPILEVLKQNQLTKILAVVVRYFGGIKLGAGGLIRAYSSSVSQALQKCQIIMNLDQDIINLTLAYHHNDNLQFFLNDHQTDIHILDTRYTDKVTYQLAFYPESLEKYKEKITNLLNGQLDWQFVEGRTVNLPKK